MKQINIILIFLLSASMYARNDFLKEGNISYAGENVNIVNVVSTQRDSVYMALVDEEPTINGASRIVLIDANASSGSGYIEIIPLVQLTTNIAGIFIGARFNKIYKRSGANNTYFIVGYLPATAPVVTHGFVYRFDYTIPNYPTNPIDTLPTDVSISSFGEDYNVSNVADIFEVAGNFILSGSIYDHIGIERYTSPVGGATIVLNENRNLVWIARVGIALDIQKQYINSFITDTNHLILDSVLGYESNITAMGYVDADRKLLMLELNQSDNVISPILENVSNYAGYTKVYNDIATGTSIDIGAGTAYAGDRLEAGSSVSIQYYSANATVPAPAPFVLPGPISTLPYALNNTANITVAYDGYVEGISDLWDFMDINCSDTTGTSRDLETIYVVPFPVGNITDTNCLPPNIKYYESDKPIPFINLQWEWIYDKKNPLRWDVVHGGKTATLPTSSITANTNYISTKSNTSTVSVLHNKIGKNQFNVIQIDGVDGSIVADRYHPKTPTDDALVAGRAILNDQDGNMVLVGRTVESNASAFTPRTTDCIAIKVDKDGNEIWEQYLGHFRDDGCSDAMIVKRNRKPTYAEYLAVGLTTSVDGAAGEEQGWAVTFRDSGTLLSLNYQWNLIGNPVDREIGASSSTDGSNTISVADLGAHKHFFMFKDNQWLLNKLPIKPLDGFFLVSLDDKQEIFLEGNLEEQQFQEMQEGETGWVLLSTGIKLVNAKTIYDLYAIYVYRNSQYQSNPIELYPGEGFWAKKRR